MLTVEPTYKIVECLVLYILDAAPMALYSVPGCSLCYQVLHKASERRVPHSPVMAAVGSVLSLVATELFPGGVLKLCFCVRPTCVNLVFGH